jgi:hypothetical protein
LKPRVLHFRLESALSREGKPTGTLLVIAFEAAKIAKPTAQALEQAA